MLKSLSDQELFFKKKPRHSTIIFTESHKDIFIAMCQVYLPESYEDHGGFFNQENNKGVYEEKPDINVLLGLPALKKEKIFMFTV